MKILCYNDLVRLETFEERLRYLKLDGVVGRRTFGSHRYVNQRFYTSEEWKHVRDYVITRDMGCDLGIDGRDVYEGIRVHHMNPLMLDDILESTSNLLNPDYLITTSLATHNMIHYGDERLLEFTKTERRPNDTCPWKR